MRILWNYLRPHHRLALLALLLAATSQVLALIDPIIFGKIVDGYALSVAGRSDDERMSGVLRLLALVVAVAVLSRAAKALQDYVTRLVVQKARHPDLQRQAAQDAAPSFPGVRGPAQRRDAVDAAEGPRRQRALHQCLHQQRIRGFALEMQKVKRIRLLLFLQGTTLGLLKLSILFARCCG